MSLSDFTKLASGRPGTACWFQRFLLPDEESAALQEALDADPEIVTNVMIRRWLALHEILVSVTAVSSHRRGVCQCPRP